MFHVLVRSGPRAAQFPSGADASEFGLILRRRRPSGDGGGERAPAEGVRQVLRLNNSEQQLREDVRTAERRRRRADH